ncbi:two-component system sensor histidine kinase CreC [Rhodoferax ferrireducens]|uniref:histidine kinase n=1 Tax=Rhodoferax ferrireducens TaxID=192843 RepID=A0ABU2C8A2_9BURK|nr:two-component system sensor histidine kinase CreC [Rhodoferax ferrireducens]MDR7377562.1 two-component system sensor histidine kinase CreC [Rhodoferax ferrireducens]
MHLGIRILFGFFLITGLAGLFVLRIFVAEVKPSVREVMEDMMVDTANILAELAVDDLRAGNMAQGRFATQVGAYARRPIDARIWGLDKQSLDFRVYVTDAKGTVMFDSARVAVGQDYSQWRDVARTLRGEYGARATRQVYEDDRSSVLYVAAPVNYGGQVIGVLTVAKPVATVQAFIDRAERKILVSGFWLLALSAAVGMAVTLWVVYSIRQLRRYANAMEAGKKLPLPRIPGELGELARAMQAMRQRVEGRDYIEGYVRALTHELKSPLAAIRGAGELLQEPLPEPDRQEFAADVLAQTRRLQSLVDRLLELSKLEQRQELQQPQRLRLTEYLASFMALAQVDRSHIAIDLIASDSPATARIEADLLALALGNLLDNAAAFAPPGSRIRLGVEGQAIVVQDSGPGVPDYALPKLGQKFFSTVRPDGITKGSGLGLAIVQQIMALHGGHMQVRNTQPGLRVELHFPA